jgi:ATPase subunit of ABC transporter with duplicated ATPase domains
MDKHYVYSARTTEKGLALLNKTKGDRSWDEFLNEAMVEHYHLDPKLINLPPSKFLADRAAKKAAKEAEKATKKAEREAAAKAKAEKKAADKKAAAKAGTKKGATKKGGKKAEKPAPKATKKSTKTTKVTLKPGETKHAGGTDVVAPADNTHEVEVPVETVES